MLLFFIALYPDEYKAFPVWAQVIAAIFTVGVNIVAGIFWDDLKTRFENLSLRREIDKINERSGAILHAKEAELADLRKVIVQFLEYSEVYKGKIEKYLELNEDYLCIAKSSEGLSDVFKALEEKQQLPFSKVLTEWPGSIKPFEKMHLYLLPISRMEGFTSGKTREWIKKNIIPKVREERTTFLAGLTSKQRKLAQDFSYKYVAIVVRKNSIEYDSVNRKFNELFVKNIVEHQSRKRLAKLADRLTEVITAKDFFLLVDWASFAPLNNDQKALLQTNKHELYDALSKRGIKRLTDIGACPTEDLASVFQKVYKSRFTKKKYMNLAAKVILGTGEVLSVLRKSGVRI